MKKITYGFDRPEKALTIFRARDPRVAECVEVSVTLFFPQSIVCGKLETAIRDAVEKMVKGLNDGNE